MDNYSWSPHSTYFHRPNILACISPSMLSQKSQTNNSNSTKSLNKNTNINLNDYALDKERNKRPITSSYKSLMIDNNDKIKSDRTKRRNTNEFQKIISNPHDTLNSDSSTNFNYFLTTVSSDKKIIRNELSPNSNTGSTSPLIFNPSKGLQFFPKILINNNEYDLINNLNYQLHSKDKENENILNESNPFVTTNISPINNNISPVNTANNNNMKTNKEMNISLSANTKRELETSGKRKKIMASNDAMAQISNVYDKSQINSAVMEINNTTERVKMLDLILKRREEIKLLENQERFDKYAPVLRKFARNFRLRMEKKNANSSDKKNQDLLNNLPAYSINTNDEHCFSSRSSFFRTTPTQDISIDIDLPKNSLDSSYYNTSGCEQNQEKIGMPNKLRMMLVKKPTKYINNKNFLVIEDDDQMLKSSTANKKSRTMRSRKMSLKNHLESAKETIINDIYHYLIKNNNTSKSIIDMGIDSPEASKRSYLDQNSKQYNKKTNEIAQIDENVRMKYEKHQREIFRKAYQPSFLNMLKDESKIKIDNNSNIITYNPEDKINNQFKNKLKINVKLSNILDNIPIRNATDRKPIIKKHYVDFAENRSLASNESTKRVSKNVGFQRPHTKSILIRNKN